MIPRNLRLAYILFAILTLNTFGGPLALVAVLRGGDHPGWPPDRAVEWATLLAVTGLTVLILVLLGLIWVGHMREMQAAKEARRRAETPR
jgi:hypothetical protein